MFARPARDGDVNLLWTLGQIEVVGQWLMPDLRIRMLVFLRHSRHMNARARENLLLDVFDAEPVAGQGLRYGCWYRAWQDDP